LARDRSQKPARVVLIAFWSFVLTRFPQREPVLTPDRVRAGFRSKMR
jgi:hypothetical protein